MTDPVALDLLPARASRVASWVLARERDHVDRPLRASARAGARQPDDPGRLRDGADTPVRARRQHRRPRPRGAQRGGAGAHVEPRLVLGAGRAGVRAALVGAHGRGGARGAHRARQERYLRRRARALRAHPDRLRPADGGHPALRRLALHADELRKPLAVTANFEIAKIHAILGDRAASDAFFGDEPSHPGLSNVYWVTRCPRGALAIRDTERPRRRGGRPCSRRRGEVYPGDPG